MSTRSFMVSKAMLSGLLCVAFSSTANAQHFPTPVTATVPGEDLQLDGPIYDYEMALHEVTNSQFATFLNNAEFHNEVQNPGFGNLRGSNLLFRPAPFNFGDIGLVDGSEVDGIFDISRSLLTYNFANAIGSRYGVVAGKLNHPVVGMSWIGAVKFCNWLTLDQGLSPDERCYQEGEGEGDWYPLTIGTEIRGTQKATNAVRDLNAAERWQLVHDFRGYRLPMDGGGTAVGSVNAVPREFNEWYKAASYDPAAPDVTRIASSGAFEQHTVPADHWIHGFGRDPLTNSDANFRTSGDPFDDPDAAVIATTPVGYYDGSLQGGVFQTTADNNHYGLFDASGNVWEFLTDQVEISVGTVPDRSIVGGSYRSNTNQVATANRGDIENTSTRPVVGLRVMRVAKVPAIEDLGGQSAGIAGEPHLRGLGALIGGRPLRLEVRRAPSNTVIFRWLSIQSQPLPFLGGTVHTFPLFKQKLFMTNGDGEHSFAAARPNGIQGGVELWLQYLILDTSVVDDFTLSNAIKLTTP